MKKRYLIFYAITLLAGRGYAQQTRFDAEFAPTAPAVSQPESGFREAVCLNGSWKFYGIDDAGKLTREQIKTPAYPVAGNWEPTAVKVPSPWNVNNFATENIAGGDFVTYSSYPKRWENVRAGWLMRKISYRKQWKNKRLILRFEGVGGFTQVYLNKQKIAENFDVFLPFEVDITGKLKEGDDNELSLWVADGKLLNQEGQYGNRVFVAGSFWGQHVRGIWQDVNLLVKPEVYIANTYIQPLVDKDSLLVTVSINNTTSQKRTINLGGTVSPWMNLAGKSTVEAPEVKWQLGNTALSLPQQSISLKPNAVSSVTLKVKVNNRLKKWAAGQPNLYGLVLSAGTLDKQYTRFGWRQFSLVKDKLLLNGEPVVLKGDSWHFMGIPQMTRRYAWAWYTALKDANANAVRLHAQPYPAFYLDMADEMGIYVLDESGMWASDGGPKVDSEDYWKASEDHLKRFIMRDRNHPAVFGWSVCNENLAVTIGVLHSPEPIVKRQLAEINKWIAITRQMDPTRTWISGDGETNEPTDLPTVIGHYGDDNAYKDWSAQGKAWGIGESGMAYYGTPQQTAQYNGNRSYQSQLGRMEGVAIEATKLLNLQKQYKASYNSVFNIVWYGLQPLELGLADTTRKPEATDGIFFGPYVEGKGGVQPERLGPYTTTLNPGYDSRLPLYKKWPLFDAVQKAFGTDAVSSNGTNTANINAANPAAPAKAANLLLLSADRDSVLYRIFSEMGLSVNKPDKRSAALLIIDGIHPPADAKAMALKNEVLKKGGNVLVWGVSDASLQGVNAYLPSPAALTQRKATSFITTAGTDALLNNLGNADFYFTELSERPVAVNGLAGEFVDKGTTLLTASNTDWATWNKQAEYLKTAAVLRSEREAKPKGNALVSAPAGNGRVYVMTLDPAVVYKSSPALIKNLLANMGVSFNTALSERNVLTTKGNLNRVLFIDPFNARSEGASEKKDFLAGARETDFVPGGQVNNHTWKLINAEADDSFNPATGKENEVGYYSFWIYTPRSLSNLLLEPDMPKIDINLKTANESQLTLNGKPLTLKAATGTQVAEAIPLEKGWNHVIVRTIRKTADWKTEIKLSSDKKDFLNKDIKVQAFN